MDPKIFDNSGKRVWVAGHRGMVGGAVVRRLAREKCEILTVAHSEIDRTRQSDVERWLDKQRPDAIVMAAARVGGIHANSTLPAEFRSINLMIGTNVVSAAHKVGVRWLLNLGSSDDAADAIVFILGRYSAGEPINIGIGVDVSMRELADSCSDNSRLAAFGWHASPDLADGPGEIYQWHCNNKVSAAA